MKAWPVFLLGIGPALADTPLSTEDFAYGLTLEPRTAAPAYELELPDTVYQQTLRSDLGDIRVFNAAGEIVAHDLYRPPPETEYTTMNLPFFPLTGEETTAEALSLRLKRTAEPSAERTVVELNIEDGGAASPINRYLIDARKATRPIRALNLSWESAEQGFLLRALLEASADLREWRTLVHDAAIADLSFAGNRLQRSHIALHPSESDYLRLTLSDDRTAPRLNAISAELTATAREPALRWTPVTVTAEKSGEYLFDLPGVIEARRVKVNLPQPNTLVEATLLSRPEDKTPWRTRGHGLLYRLTVRDTTLANDILTVAASQERRWLLRIDPSGGGLGSGLPAITLGWYPHTLVFVARGAGPFTLAYGSARATPVGAKAYALLRQVARATGTDLASNAIDIGEPIELGGEDALAPPPMPMDWKTLLLWAVLLAGVVLLAWMAWHLLRDLDAKA